MFVFEDFDHLVRGIRELAVSAKVEKENGPRPKDRQSAADKLYALETVLEMLSDYQEQHKKIAKLSRKSIEDLRDEIKNYRVQAEHAMRTNPVGGREYRVAYGEVRAMKAVLGMLSELRISDESEKSTEWEVVLVLDFGAEGVDPEPVTYPFQCETKARAFFTMMEKDQAVRSIRLYRRILEEVCP